MSYDFAGRCVVITGAGSGIGRQLAYALALRGARLALVDQDQAGLVDTVAGCVPFGVRARAKRLDVSDRDAVLAYADEVARAFGTIDVVINNAGIAYTGDVDETGFAELERVLDVDFWGVVNGTKAFLPHLVASGDGRLVNVSSAFGLIAVPSQAAYNAAKFAVRGFTEALQQELALTGQPVRVTCVLPGGVRTAIVRNSGVAPGRDRAAIATLFERRMARTTPERAAAVILRGVAAGRPRVLVGADARAIDLLARIAGPHYQRLVTAAARRSR